MNVTIATGRATSGIGDSLFKPNQPPARPLPPVLYLHGVSGNAAESVYPSTLSITAPIVAAGYTVGSISSAHTWGNATAKSRVTDLLALMRANGSSTDRAILIGGSHGGAWALNYAADNPGLVAGVVGLIPAIDLQAIRAADTLGLRASIDAAFGVTYPTALPAGSDPATRTATLAQVPIQLWYATDDAVSANASTFQAATGCDLRPVGALGHSEAAVYAADEQAILRFVQHHSPRRGSA